MMLNGIASVSQWLQVARDVSAKSKAVLKADAEKAAPLQSVDFSAQRKGAAKEKLGQLKQQMMSLQLVANANPKGVAKQIATLARQLGQTAKEYGQAGEAEQAKQQEQAAEEQQQQAEQTAADKPLTREEQRQTYLDAYHRRDASYTDSRFMGEVRQLYGQMQNLMRFEIQRASSKDKELEAIAKDFVKSAAMIDEAEKVAQADKSLGLNISA